MYYIISDIHNDNKRFQEMLQHIRFSKESDHLYILGDLFDRSAYNPDPVGVYFTILELGESCTVIRGNHDNLLAEYILNYFNTAERKRAKLAPYPYNSFDLLVQRLTPVDMQELAKLIMSWPLQVAITLDKHKYLLAHAMTSKPDEEKDDNYYLDGEFLDDSYLENGIEGYISICGHSSTDNQRIWKNAIGNVYRCDCGCGYRSGKLGCLCLKTREEFYV